MQILKGKTHYYDRMLFYKIHNLFVKLKEWLTNDIKNDNVEGALSNRETKSYRPTGILGNIFFELELAASTIFLGMASMYVTDKSQRWMLDFVEDFL